MVAHKASSLVLSPKMFIDDIASLTELELYYNPIHSKLRKYFDYVSNTLAKYLARDLSGPQVVPSTTFVPDIRQGT